MNGEIIVVKRLTSFELEDNSVNEVAGAITNEILGDLYIGSNDAEKANIFFNLQYIFLRLKDSENKDLAAHIAFIISYYIFVLLTPPHSEEIALYYAIEAAKLANMDEKYTNWIEFVKSGN